MVTLTVARVRTLAQAQETHKSIWGNRVLVAPILVDQAAETSGPGKRLVLMPVAILGAAKL